MSSLFQGIINAQGDPRINLEVGLEADLYGTTLPGLESFSGDDYKKLSHGTLIIRKNIKLITVLRTILTMIRDDDENLAWIDVFALFEVVLKIEKDLVNQQGFINKFGSYLKVVNEILIELNWRPTKPESALKLIRSGLRALPDSFFFDRRNMKSNISSYREKVILVTNSRSGTELKYLPPKTFVGKGYTDKGTARKPHLDGSPGWQEVAMSRKEERQLLTQNREKL